MILQQLVLPPAYLYSYGIESFGAWLIISAGIAQLGLLDFGLQTYVVNRLGVLYHTGRHEEFHRVQSIALRLVMGVAAMATIALLPLPWLPVESWLKLAIPATDARLTMLFLALAIISQIVLGQAVGIYRAIGLAHRAQHWGNLQRAAVLAALLGLISFKVSFAWLGAAQLAVSLVTLIAALVDVRRTTPRFAPRVDYWNGAEAWSLIKPSLFFGLGVLNNFLLFEAPLLILQRVSGPVAVVTFATARTLFSAGRQLLTPIQYSLIPEITRLYAVGDQQRLQELHRISEAVALVGGLALNLALALGSGAIMAFWLHGRVAPESGLVALMAVIGLVTIHRESKYLFQLATNHHERNVVFMSVCYVAMGVAGGLLCSALQERGMALAWLAAELMIIGFLARENGRLLTRPMVCSPATGLALVAFTYVLLHFGLAAVGSAAGPAQLAMAAGTGLGVAIIGLFTWGRALQPAFARLSGHFFSRERVG